MAVLISLVLVAGATAALAHDGSANLYEPYAPTYAGVGQADSITTVHDETLNNPLQIYKGITRCIPRITPGWRGQISTSSCRATWRCILVALPVK